MIQCKYSNNRVKKIVFISIKLKKYNVRNQRYNIQQCIFHITNKIDKIFNKQNEYIFLDKFTLNF